MVRLLPWVLYHFVMRRVRFDAAADRAARARIKSVAKAKTKYRHSTPAKPSITAAGVIATPPELDHSGHSGAHLAHCSK